ncbi:LuxR C-terminal-related transcriptional regulator [Phenylobacterium sp.]|uniref:LuxR C-terminal-related transcriptional regulator n=1 Tax=Phenylobacterium sp. TaxID=1871053 RepID=UPI002F953261
MLRLLAEGHMAKSIAVELGLSVNTVNERLREARRKTGAGSSRELARALKAQRLPLEKLGRGNRDGAAHGVAAIVRPGARGRFRAPVMMGAFALVLIASAAGAFAAVALFQSSAAPAVQAAPPRVVSTSPAAGAILAPGAFELKVTFDRPMTAGSHSYVGDPKTFPKCAPRATLSDDRRTFTLSCIAEAGRTYAVGFNNQLHRNFVSADGTPATPAHIRFSVR